MAKMFSEKAQAVLVHMQANQGVDEVSSQIAEATGIEKKSITGVLNGLVRKGLVERVEVEDVEGKVVRLTEAGVQADPDADKAAE